MLLQTNSYIVPKEKRSEHARLIRRFRQTLSRLGCESFEVYEQVGSNWSSADSTGRYVQIMRFRDRKHQLAVQQAERNDAAAQDLIAEFCELINFPYQQQQGLFAVGYYSSSLPMSSQQLAMVGGHAPEQGESDEAAAADEVEGEAIDVTAEDATEPQPEVASGDGIDIDDFVTHDAEETPADENSEDQRPN